MEIKISTSEINLSSLNSSASQLSLEQLITLVIDSGNNQGGLEYRQELINRGKDCIETRIVIKKSCKTAIAHLEAQIKQIPIENNKDKESVKALKNKFLAFLSILDKLQLEWQKHDISLKLIK